MVSWRAFDEAEPLLPQFPFHAVRHLVEVVAHGLGVERGADGKHVLEQAHRGIEGDQGSPFRFQTGHFRRDMLVEEVRKRIEGLSALAAVAGTAFQSRPGNRDVTEGRSETERTLALAPEAVPAAGQDRLSTSKAAACAATIRS